MTDIDFFKRIVAGNFKSSCDEFRRRWEVSISQLAAQPTKLFASLFFNVARACGRASGEYNFTSYTDRKNARNAVLKDIGKVLEKTDILEYDFIQLTQIISACEMLRIIPQDRFRDKLIQGTQSVLPYASEKACYNFINNMARLAIYPGDDWIKSWWEKTFECLDEMRSNWINDIVYRLAILDYLRSQDKKFKNIQSPCREIANGLLESYRDKKDEVFPDKRIPQQITDAAKWFDFDLRMQGFISEYESSSHSHDEKKFREAFYAAGAKLSDSYRISSNHQFDISLQFNCKSFAIEIDGDPHMLTGTADGKLYYDGSTRFQTALILKALPADLKLVRIPSVYLMGIKGLGIQQIAKSFLDASGRIKRHSVVMHGTKEFVPVIEPNCWHLNT